MNLLLVDPEQHTLEVYRDIFEIWGFEVTAVRTGSEAIQALSAGDPDLVILEDNLPDIRGEELIRSLKSRVPTLPVIVMTGNSTVRGAVNAIRAGADDYLSKSTPIEMIRDRFRDASPGRSERNEINKVQAEILTNIRRVRDHLDEVIRFIEQGSQPPGD